MILRPFGNSILSPCACRRVGIFYVFTMSLLLPSSIRELINELTKLPGIGPKSAQRITFHLLKCPQGHLAHLGQIVGRIREGLQLCHNCFILSTHDVCDICSDEQRNKNMICVVENTLDVIAIEKTREYQGVYHVLHGTISPIDGRGPKDLKIAELVAKIKNTLTPIQEIIVATNPSLEGETTALYLVRLLKPLNIKITRIALGMPVGGELEYADNVTIARALEGRREYY